MNKYKYQQGFTFISILVLPIFIVVADFIFSTLLFAQINYKLDKQIAKDLLSIKNAIIAYATTFNNKPGRVICPGIKEEGTELLTGSNCKFLVKTISWKTLDLGYKFQNTALGTEYFYQVSDSFSAGANSSKSFINQNTIGNLSLIDKNGNTIKNIVAIVAVPKTIINYDDTNIVNGNFIVDLRDTNLWKSAIYITDKEILYNTQKRITNEIFACLYNHQKNENLPNPAPLLNQTTANYQSNINSYFGRLPKTADNVGISQNLNNYKQKFNDFLPNLIIENNTENISDFGLDKIQNLKFTLTNLQEDLSIFNIYQQQIYNVLVELSNKSAEVNKSLNTLNNSYLSNAISNNKITKSQQQKVIEYSDKITQSFTELQTLFNNYNVDFYLPLLKNKFWQFQNGNLTYDDLANFVLQTNFNNNIVLQNIVNNFNFADNNTNNNSNNNTDTNLNNLVNFIDTNYTTNDKNIYNDSIKNIYNSWLANTNYFVNNTTLSGTINNNKNTESTKFFENLVEYQTNNNILISWLNDLQIIANILAIQAQKDISLSTKKDKKYNDANSITNLSIDIFSSIDSLNKKIDSYLNRQNKTNRDKLNTETQNFFTTYQNFLNNIDNQTKNLFGYYAQQWEIIWQSSQCMFLFYDKYNRIYNNKISAYKSKDEYYSLYQQQWDDIFFYQLQKNSADNFFLNKKKISNFKKNNVKNFVIITANNAINNQQRNNQQIQITDNYFENCNVNISRNNLAENPNINFCYLNQKYNSATNKNFNDILRFNLYY